ncbi:hypothetical protein [Embleya sp. NPDC059237]|uniref:hypothetical protein n=1 Tax=Embleya sp. NPDC059237 TaxID=3346784 RepID=UPI0036BE7727
MTEPTVHTVHTWEGRILDLNGDTFTAELHPTSMPGRPVLADFDLTVLGDDATHAAPGDAIDVTIPTHPRDGGGKVRLRRLGPVTSTETRAAYAEADEWLERLWPLFDEEPRR